MKPVLLYIWLLFGWAFTTQAAGLQASPGVGSAQMQRIDTLIGQARQNLENHPEAALKLGFQAVSMSIQIDYLSGHTSALNVVGLGYYYLNNYKKAMQYFMTSYSKARERKQDLEAGEALYHMGLVYYDWGDYHKSLNYFFQSRNLREKIRDKPGVAQSLNHIGLVYNVQDNTDKALSYCEKALKIYDKIGREDGIAMTCSNIGAIYDKQAEYDQALEFHTKALAIQRTRKDVQGIAQSMHNIGDVYFHQGLYEKAIIYYFRALQREKKMQHRIRMATSYNSIATSYYQQKKYEQALNYYEKAIIEARKVEAKDPVMKAYQGLANSYSQLGDFKKAYSQHLQYTIVKDSIFSRQATAEIIEMEAKYELQNQQREVELLKKERKITSITLEQNRILTYSMGIVSVLLLVLGLVMINRYGIKKRTNRLLSARNQIIQNQNQELQAINRKLMESEENLQALNVTKDKFFTIISHDLRGPLNSLTGLLQMLARYVDNFSKAELKEFANNMDRSVQNLLALLENLLQWSRTQRGTIDYRPEVIPLNDLVNEICEFLEVMAVSKQIALFSSIPNELHVYADKNMLSFILRNMLFNAIKFTHAGGKVEVSATQIGSQVEIAVSDTGIGIHENDIDKLFRIDTFHTTNGTANEVGTGLGLILCNEFVQQHGGTILVESKIHEGTTFRFTMPAQVFNYFSTTKA
jgi:signal transduction histidine kinase